MSEDAWLAARLIPTSGINGAEEQERRATSALLAVMSAVKEFGRALTQPLGAPAGAIETYIEVPFSHDGKRLYPDGLIRVARGQRLWTALVEVKTGANDLQPEQLEAYLEIARDHGFDALITISNEIPPSAGQHPTKVDRRRTKKVELIHLPWSQILAEAVMQKEHRGVADTDQAWILGELIRYLEHPRSGAMEFSDMGGSWVTVRDAVTAGTLRATDAGVPEVVGRFDALMRFTCLRLGRQLGIDVVPALSRNQLANPAVRTAELVQQLVGSNQMTAGIRIPSAVGPLSVTVDLRASRIICHVDVDSPREGRPTTRVNWLVRQLKNAPDDLRLEAFAMHARGIGTAALLGKVREDPSALIGDPTKELKSFRIAQTTAAGLKRGRGRGGFVDSILDAIDLFYINVLQNLKPWMPSPPRMRPEEAEIPHEPVRAPLISTAISSQDGANAGPPESAIADLELAAEDTRPDPVEEVPTPPSEAMPASEEDPPLSARRYIGSDV